MAIDQLLEDFSYSPHEKKALLLMLSRSFGEEFGKDKFMARQLSDKFRKHRESIEALFKGQGINNGIEYICKLINKRSAKNKPAVSMILNQYDSGSIMIPQNDLLSSLIHMSMNRVFKNNNRRHEFVIYDLLHRYYKMKLAKRKA